MFDESLALDEEDQEEDEPHYAFLDPEDQSFLKEWLLDIDNWQKMKSLGK